MRIRQAAVGDIPELQSIRMIVRENRLADLSRVQPHHVEEMILERGRGWVAVLDERIAGFAIADLTTSSVWALFVDPGFEKRGIGRRLHDTMISWMFDTGVERISLCTEPGTRAERFYKTAGWVHTGEEENGDRSYEMTRAARSAQATAADAEGVN